jgi:hypothetical protein
LSIQLRALIPTVHTVNGSSVIRAAQWFLGNSRMTALKVSVRCVYVFCIMYNSLYVFMLHIQGGIQYFRDWCRHLIIIRIFI